MYFLQAINNDISVLIVCNKNGDKKKPDTYTYIHIYSCHKSNICELTVQYVDLA